MQVFHTCVSSQSRILLNLSFQITRLTIYIYVIAPHLWSVNCRQKKITFSRKCSIYIFLLKPNQTHEIFRMRYLFIIIKYIFHWNLLFYSILQLFAFCERFSFLFGDVAELFVASMSQHRWNCRKCICLR